MIATWRPAPRRPTSIGLFGRPGSSPGGRSCHVTLRPGHSPGLPPSPVRVQLPAGRSPTTMHPKYTRDGDDKNRSDDQPRSFLVGDTVFVLPPKNDGEDRDGDGELRTRWG